MLWPDEEEAGAEGDRRSRMKKIFDSVKRPATGNLRHRERESGQKPRGGCA
jgi:hypothetical protein